jgi:hypothetical protein
VELIVGSKTIPTTFFVISEKGSYSLLLGMDWILANCCIMLSCPISRTKLDDYSFCVKEQVSTDSDSKVFTEQPMSQISINITRTPSTRGSRSPSEKSSSKKSISSPSFEQHLNVEWGIASVSTCSTQKVWESVTYMRNTRIKVITSLTT